MTPTTATRLTRAELFSMIEVNGGPQGLDLSGLDLQGIDLSSDVLRVELTRLGNPYESPPIWYNIPTEGIYLAGAMLQRANLRGALLWRGDFTGADFEGANLERADLGVAVLSHANLRHVRLDHATLARADVSKADFTGAYLTGCDAASVNFGDAASLDGIHFAGATLSLASVRREQFRQGVGEEKDRQFVQAKESYLAIRNGALTSGRYSDASWAYFKERQMDKKANNPFRAWKYFRTDELPAKGGGVWVRVAPFFARHTFKWAFDWLAELSCGFGERPVRTVGWAGVVVLMFPLLFFLAGGLLGAPSLPQGWLQYLEYSFAAFTTTSLVRVTPASDACQLLTSLESALGIASLSLLMFALGNRIARS